MTIVRGMAETEVKAPTVAELVGRNMRRVREAHAKVLLDVANAARDRGLTWDASAVSRIETGRRALTLDEFVALPLVMTLAVNEVITMVDLLAGPAYDAMDNFGRPLFLLDVHMLLAEPHMSRHRWSGWTKLSGWVAEKLEKDKREVQAQREPDEDDPHSYDWYRETSVELGAEGVSLLTAMRELWDRTFKGERERRLVESGEDLSNPTRVRTLRGHLTRQMKAELREYFAAKKETNDVER